MLEFRNCSRWVAQGRLQETDAESLLRDCQGSWRADVRCSHGACSFFRWKKSLGYVFNPFVPRKKPFNIVWTQFLSYAMAAIHA